MIILKLYGFLFISLYIIYTILHYFMENKIDRYLFAFDECSKLLSKCVWLEKKMTLVPKGQQTGSISTNIFTIRIYFFLNNTWDNIMQSYVITKLRLKEDVH